jgi:hypothetical protein
MDNSAKVHCDGEIIDLLPCPSCGGTPTVSIRGCTATSAKSNVVGCDGIMDEDASEYVREPCGLEISAFVDQREVDDLIRQWNLLPRKTNE